MADNSLIDTSQLTTKLGNYQVGKSQALLDNSLLLLVRNYKRTVASRMYPLSPDDVTGCPLTTSPIKFQTPSITSVVKLTANSRHLSTETEI